MGLLLLRIVLFLAGVFVLNVGGWVIQGRSCSSEEPRFFYAPTLKGKTLAVARVDKRTDIKPVEKLARARARARPRPSLKKVE